MTYNAFRTAAVSVIMSSALALSLPDIKGGLDKLGVQIEGSTPERLQAWIDAEKTRWSSIIRRSNIRGDQR